MNTLEQSSPQRDLASASTPELRAALAEAFSLTVEKIVQMAAIVAELERRGEDLSELQMSMIGYLRRIAAGQMLPEIAVRYHGCPMLISRAGVLPMPDQERLLREQSVTVYELDDAGEPTHRKIPAHLMSAPQIRQVFGRDSIRDEQQQLLWLKEHRPRSPRRGSDGVVLDMRRIGIKVGDVFIGRAELADYLAKLSR